LRGSGTKDFYGERLEGEPLELAPYRGIIDYEPSELVLVARCGTPLSEIQHTLASGGQFLAFEPPALGGDPTLGGIIAAGLSGPRRLSAGAARDFVLGATLLGSDGELLRFGGRVMKNVAGFDIARLLCGSLGTLGIITEVSIKVLPLPRTEATLRFEMSADEALLAFNRWSGRPLPISGAAWSAGVAWLRLSGAAAAVRAACEELGGERVETVEAVQWWDSLRHCQHEVFRGGVVWRLALPAGAPALDLPGQVLIDWGGTLRWYAGEAHTLPSPRVRAVASAVGGTALCWRGPVSGSRFHPLQPAVALLHQRLKDRFDPERIFNRGRLLATL
jgi:glycolate oxidase FAD binding subunit